MAFIYEEIPTPGFYKGDTHKGFDELLYSEARYTQKGMTLPSLEEFEGDESEWELGTVMAEGDDGLYYPHGSAQATGPAEGLLRHSIKLYSGRRQSQNLMISGIAKLEKVRGYDQAALDALGAVISTRRSTFKF